MGQNEGKTENRRQRTENRRQRTEGRGQTTENRGQTEDRGHRTEIRGHRTEDRGHRTEGRGQKIEGRQRAKRIIRLRRHEDSYANPSKRIQLLAQRIGPVASPASNANTHHGRRASANLCADVVAATARRCGCARGGCARRSNPASHAVNERLHSTLRGRVRESKGVGLGALDHLVWRNSEHWLERCREASEVQGGD
eukprot:171570-Chlamydomonas_euryale.AAC.3